MFVGRLMDAESIVKIIVALVGTGGGLTLIGKACVWFLARERLAARNEILVEQGEKTQKSLADENTQIRRELAATKRKLSRCESQRKKAETA